MAGPPEIGNEMTINLSTGIGAPFISHSDADVQLLYFTSPSLTADDQGIVFLSNVNGQPNLFFRDLTNGDERQLSHNRDGVLQSYVYFDGRPGAGLGKASISLDPHRGLVYYLQGQDLVATDLLGKLRVLATIPDDQVTAFTHVSNDGSRLCVPTTDAAVLRDELIRHPQRLTEIDRAVQRDGLTSWLRVYDTATGEMVGCEPVAQAWVTHVQFSPTDREMILYNHEWANDCGMRRMWLWDGRRHLRLRPEAPEAGRSRHDWVCHEMWSRDGQSILYHGRFADGPSFLGRVRPDATGHIEIPFDLQWQQYGHFTTSGRDDLTVSDGYYRPPARETPDSPDALDDADDPHGQWISLQHIDWDRCRIDWQPLCRHGSSWSSQDAHPHPVFNHAGDAVYFTSDRDGRRAIYRLQNL